MLGNNPRGLSTTGTTCEFPKMLKLVSRNVGVHKSLFPLGLLYCQFSELMVHDSSCYRVLVLDSYSHASSYTTQYRVGARLKPIQTHPHLERPTSCRDVATWPPWPLPHKFLNSDSIPQTFFVMCRIAPSRWSIECESYKCNYCRVLLIRPLRKYAPPLFTAKVPA